jgi:hypothetical protein
MHSPFLLTTPMNKTLTMLCGALSFASVLLSAELDRQYLKLDQAVRVEGDIKPRQDLSVMGQAKISIGGFLYDRGLGVHADSTLVFALDERFATFHVVPGPDDAHQGAVEMKILLDGKEVYASGTVRSHGYVAPVLEIPLEGARELTLIVTDADGNKGGDHASWADATLLPAGYVDPADVSPLAAYWDFGEQPSGQTLELVGRKRDQVSGFTQYAEGVRGPALKFDGFTSKAVRQAAAVLSLENDFTFEAWIAILVLLLSLLAPAIFSPWP